MAKKSTKAATEVPVKLTDKDKKTLGSLRDIAREVATAEGVVFANVHDPMIDAIEEKQTK